jgi:hypothetical protein
MQHSINVRVPLNGVPSVLRCKKLHERPRNDVFGCHSVSGGGTRVIVRNPVFLLVLLTLAAPVAAQRQVVGIYSNWGAFLEQRPRRCFAIAQPSRSPRSRDWKPFATISFWPERRVRGQVHFRLSRVKREGSAVLLKIDGRPFQLMAGGRDAWGPDPRGDAEIIAAMRGGIEMIVETRSERGALVRDYYQLRGAATAIDAAALACARPA